MEQKSESFLTMGEMSVENQKAPTKAVEGSFLDSTTFTIRERRDYTDA